jgi:hypothetical protein
MSYVVGENSEDPRVHFRAGMKDFLRLDQVRLMNITGSIFYGFIYILLFLIMGIILHSIFPVTTSSQSLSSLFGWILLHCFIIIISVFYIRKLVESIPGPIYYFPEYLKKLQQEGLILHGIDEYKGDMAASVIFIGTQYRLLEKIALLTNKLSLLLF